MMVVMMMMRVKVLDDDCEGCDDDEQRGHKALFFIFDHYRFESLQNLLSLQWLRVTSPLERWRV